MPTGDSGIEHCVLHRVLNGSSTEVVVNGVTTTEKIQKIGVVSNRCLCNLGIDASLRQFFEDEHEFSTIILLTDRFNFSLHDRLVRLQVAQRR